MAPGYKDLYKDYAKRYNQSGVYNKAENLYKKYNELEPGNTEVLKGLAESSERQGKLGEALSYYKEISSLDSDNAASKKGIERVNDRMMEIDFSENAKAKEAAASVEAGDLSFIEKDFPVSKPEEPKEAENAAAQKQEADSKERERRDAFSFENLVKDAGNMNEAFDSSLDDEILADNVAPESLDNLADDESDDYDDEDFFKNNPFSSGTKSTFPDEEAFNPDFSPETLDYDKKEPQPFNLDSMPGNEPKPQSEPLPQQPQQPEYKEPAFQPEPPVTSGLSDEDRQRTVDEAKKAALEALEQQRREDESERAARREKEDEVLRALEEATKRAAEEARLAREEREKLEAQALEQPSREPEVQPDPYQQEMNSEFEEKQNRLDEMEQRLNKQQELLNSQQRQLEEAQLDFEERLCNQEALTNDEEQGDVLLDDDLVTADNPSDFEIPDEELTPVEQKHTSADELIDDSSFILQEVLDVLAENELSTKFALTREFFMNLKALSNFMSSESKKQYMQGRARLQLEYLVCKLSGKKSLLARASVIRYDELGDENVMVPFEKRVPLFVEVVKGIMAHVKNLPDEDMVEYYESKLDSLLEKVKEVEFFSVTK